MLWELLGMANTWQEQQLISEGTGEIGILNAELIYVLQPRKIIEIRYFRVIT